MSRHQEWQDAKWSKKAAETDSACCDNLSMNNAIAALHTAGPRACMPKPCGRQACRAWLQLMQVPMVQACQSTRLTKGVGKSVSREGL